MPTGTPQVTFSLDNPGALPGQRFDSTDEDFIVSYPCGSGTLQAGVGVELVGGLLQIAQGTGDPDSNPIWGVVMYKSAQEPGPFNPGDQVPVIRRGRVAVLLASGVTVTVGLAANLTHSSTGVNPQGLFTNSPNSATVGSEISDIGAKWYRDVGLVGASPSVAVIELNLPQKGV